MADIFGRNEIIELLRKGKFEDLKSELDGLAAATRKEILNEVVPGFNKGTLLHDVINSEKLRSKEAVKILIEKGANPLVFGGNGDTPLHLAPFVLNMKNDKQIVETLLHTKHLECPEPPCYCGLKALSIKNKELKYPKSYDTNEEFMQYLVEEELLYNLEVGRDVQSIFQMLDENFKTGFSAEFPAKFISKIIELESEGSNHHLLLPFVLHFWPNLWERKLYFLDKAFRPEKICYNSLFMLGSLKELSTGIFTSMKSWMGDSPYFDRDHLPSDDKKYNEEEMNNEIEKFIINEKNIISLIVAAANCENGDGILNQLLKLFSKMVEESSKELPWNGLNLKFVDIFNKLHEDTSKSFTMLNLANNRLIKCPPVWKHKGFHWHNLTKLKIHNNQLKSICKEVFEMALLVELNLSGNQLKEIPSKVDFSISLRSLFLNDNKLSDLPDSFQKSMISSLHLARNEFESVPICVCLMRWLKTLDLDGNKRIVDFPLEMGKMDPSTEITYEDIQLSYPTYVKTSKDIINYLRTKLHKSVKNKEMNLLVIGPKGHGKTTILNKILNHSIEGNPPSTSEVDFRQEPYKFWKTKPFVCCKLKAVDFPGNIEYSHNQCFLTNRSLYLLTWDVSKEPEKLNRWIDCLVSIDVPDSLVMIIGTFKNKKEYKDTEEEQLEKLKDYAKKNPNFSKLRFGLWCKKGNIGLHWFSFVDINSSKEIKELRKRIEKVASSIPLCPTRSSEVKMLGGEVPRFYFSLKDHADEYQNDDNNDEEDVFLYRDKVEDILSRQQLYNNPLRCCCNTTDLSLQKRDIDDAIRFLNDTGHLLHFDDINHSLNNLYFINLKWLNDFFVNLRSKYSNRDVPMTHREIETALHRNNLTGNVVQQLIQRCYMGFSVSKDEIQLCNDSWINKVMEKAPQNDFVNCKERLCRVHVFNTRPVPFGFWLRLLSRLNINILRLLIPYRSAYAGYRNQPDPQEKTAIGFRSNIIQSKDEFRYVDPDNELFVSVKQVRNSRKANLASDAEWWEKWPKLEGKAAIITEVISSDFNVASHVFTAILDHIETLLDQWHRFLPTSDLNRISPCLCKDLNNTTPCKEYKMCFCFEKFRENGFDADGTLFKCDRDLEIKLVRIFPDLAAAEIPDILLADCHELKEGKLLDDGGGNGNIYYGQLTSCKGEVLSVVIKKPKRELDLENFLKFKNESVMAFHLADHPYITTFFGIKYLSDKGAMIMERAECPLSGELEKGAHLDLIVCSRISYQIADALNFMHSINIVHRDMKPDNVLLFKDREIFIKLADFGTACYADSQGMNQLDVGSRPYQSPELFNYKSSFTQSADIYAYGLTLYVILSLERPFKGLHELSFHQIMGSKETFKRGLKLEKIRKDRLCLQRLMERCTQYEKSDRDRQMNGNGLVFMLKQPCIQLLLNSILLSTTDESILYFLPCSTGVDVFLWSQNEVKRYPILFKEVKQANEEFWELGVPTALPNLNPDKYVSIRHVIRRNNHFLFILECDKNSFWFLPMTVNESNRTVPINELVDCSSGDVLREVKDMKRIVSVNDWVYFYYEDTQGLHQLKRVRLPTDDVPFNSFMVIYEDWNIYEDMNSLVDICIHAEYKVIALRNSVILYSNDYNDEGYGEPNEFPIQGDEIVKITLLHPYLMIQRASSELIFLHISKISEEEFKFDIFECKLGEKYGDMKSAIISYCTLFDKIWLGMHTGHIIILTLPTHDNGLKEIRKKVIRPYTSAVEKLFAYDVASESVNYIPEFVLSYGKTLNKDAFYENIDFSYPSHLEKIYLDRTFLGHEIKPEESCSKDLLLLWHATGKKVGEEYNFGEEYNVGTEEIVVTNNKLEDLKGHKLECPRHR